MSELTAVYIRLQVWKNVYSYIFLTKFILFNKVKFLSSCNIIMQTKDVGIEGEKQF
jgi:hypothetical protein